MTSGDRLRSRLTSASLIAAALLLVVAALYRAEIQRVYKVINLFDRQNIVINFRSMEHLFPTKTVRRGDTVYEFERDPRELPTRYRFRDRTKSIADFLHETWTTGLVVIHGDRIVFEEYYRGNTPNSKTISWSLAKSFVSALIGIAVAEGRIENIRQPVTDYVPKLRGTGYDGVAIRDVLQMSSGVRFNEDYGDFFSDINRLGRAVAFSKPLDELVASLERERPPGTYNKYVSIDTQVLAMVLRAATGETLTKSLESRIWQPMGAEADAHWLIDSNGMELAFGGLNAVLRDYARFGLLYLHEGRWQGRQIVPADWVRASILPDAPHLQPGDNPLSNSVLGYGYQWWIPQQPDGDFLAIGIYNQFIYIYPRYNVVIAKSSAYPDYNHDGTDKELESIAVFRAIASELGK